jgi:hypothetical protein
MTFNIWDGIDLDCKTELYATNNRWHNDAMRAEQNDAEHFCRTGPRDSVASDTYADNMTFDIIHAVNGSKCANAGRGTGLYARVLEWGP